MLALILCRPLRYERQMAMHIFCVHFSELLFRAYLESSYHFLQYFESGKAKVSFKTTKIDFKFYFGYCAKPCFFFQFLPLVGANRKGSRMRWTRALLGR